jgi:hypothetical protein
MIPLTRQTLCFKTTIWGSSGCDACSSRLTSSYDALCSAESCIAKTSPVPLTSLPRTARESPRFATYRVPAHTTPTRQHEPTDANCGLIAHWLLTTEINPSSVTRKAFRITSVDMHLCSDANPEKGSLSCNSTNKIGK